MRRYKLGLKTRCSPLSSSRQQDRSLRLHIAPGNSLRVPPSEFLAALCLIDSPHKRWALTPNSLSPPQCTVVFPWYDDDPYVEQQVLRLSTTAGFTSIGSSLGPRLSFLMKLSFNAFSAHVHSFMCASPGGLSREDPNEPRPGIHIDDTDGREAGCY